MTFLSPQIVVLIYWLIIIPLAAFFLRQACSLCGVNMPSWKRSIISVMLVTFLAYLTFDYTSYLIMRTLDGVALRVPPWYGYNFWFREPLGLKWQIISYLGPLKYLPFVFAICAAGILQVCVLEAEVTFGWGLGIVVIQTIATCISAYIVSLVLGSVLQSAGWTVQGEPVAVAASGQQQSANPPPAGGKVRENRNKARALAKNSKQADKTKGQPSQEDAAKSPPEGEPLSLELVQRKAEDVAQSSSEYAKTASANLKDYANSQLEQLEEDLAPVTKRLPEPVQEFLARGGWWVILGGCAFIVLLWLRSILRRLGRGPRKKTRKKKARMKKVGLKLKENLTWIGKGFTEEGPRQITVNGLPAHLRLIILSMGNRTGGELSEEMADRVLDWIKTDLAQVASYDSPGVRLWPPFYSAEGFASNLASNVPIPEAPGIKSHWVLVAGRAKMGRVLINVGLAFYADEANSLRVIKVRGERWLKVIGVTEAPAMAGRR